MLDKIQLIKDYRGKTGCSLIEAKHAIEDFIERERTRRPQWEYKQYWKGVHDAPPNLTEFGSDGWELCAAYEHYFYFKRRR